ADVAASIGRRLADAAVAATVDGVTVDLGRPILADAELAILTGDSADGLYVLRHSTAHVLAQAVLDLFPGARYAIGPPIADGFYYDFEVGRTFTPDDLERIEKRMREIVESAQPFVREDLSKNDAKKIFAHQPFKLEIIDGVEEA